MPVKKKEYVPAPGDIVIVDKKTRGRFKGITTQPSEEQYYVLNTWTSAYGSLKLSLINKEGEDSYTTGTCCNIIIRDVAECLDPDTCHVWDMAKIKYMEKTFIPAIILTVRNYKGGVARSATTDSVLVRPVGKSDIQFWLSKRNCHPEDWKHLRGIKKSGEALSVRIPEWLAVKNKLFG